MRAKFIILFVGYFYTTEQIFKDNNIYQNKQFLYEKPV